MIKLPNTNTFWVKVYDNITSNIINFPIRGLVRTENLEWLLNHTCY